MAELLVQRLESNKSSWVKAQALDTLAPGKVSLTGHTVQQSRVNLTWETLSTSELITEKLSGDGSKKIYQLKFVDIAASTVIVKVDGVTKALTTDYKVDYAAGVLTFMNESVPEAATENIVVEYRKQLTDLSLYRIYRKANVADQWTVLTTVGQHSTTYTDTTMADGANYFYAITALDNAATPNEGEMSEMQVVKTVPTVPQNLTASSGDGTIRLSWDTVKKAGTPKFNENLYGYRVYRNIVGGSGAYEFLTEIAGDVNIYEDSTVLNGQDYWYVVTSVDNSTDDDRRVTG